MKSFSLLLGLYFLSQVFALGLPSAWGQDTKPEPMPAKTGEQMAPTDAARAEFIAALDIIAKPISSATVSRATVETTSRAKFGGQEATNEKAVYQIASSAPKNFTVYYKSPDQPFRIFCNGEQAAVLVSPQAYFVTEVPESLQAAVLTLPVPLGPYPELILALTLCGVDPKLSLLTDMASTEIVDRDPYDNTAAVHLRGVQLDGVKWDLWIGTEPTRLQPLRMLLDLTEVVKSEEGAALPADFTYEVEVNFTQWRINGSMDAKLFTLIPPADAVQYKSLDDYFQATSNKDPAHELIGQTAPDFEAVLFAHETAPAIKEPADTPGHRVKLSDLKDKIVVLDFWATWCGPCVEAMPIVAGVTKNFADRGVEFYAINAGETIDDVVGFFAGKELKPNVLLDPDGKISDAFKANAIPQTVIVGKQGRVEIVHVGYSSLAEFEQELSDQLEVLASGGTLIPEVK